KDGSDSFTIDGKITGAENQRIILQTFSFPNINGSPKTTVIDTARADKEGKFTIKNYLPERTICVVKVFGNEEYALWLSLLNEDITLTGNIANALETTTEGSVASKVLYNFIVNMSNMNASIMQNQGMYAKYKNNGDDSLATVYKQKINDDITVYFDYVSAFADTTKDIASAVLAIESFVYSKQFEKIKTVADKRKLTADSSSLYMKELKVKIAKHETFMQQASAKSFVGKPAPDIVLPDPGGVEYKLSDLKGQYVLIDFWASWCKPCREENPNLVATYNKYKDKGYTVYSVSLDKSKEAWQTAIDKDKLTWKYHVSELQMWNSQVAKMYNVTGIPMNFLLDKNGNVIAENLRGTELDAALAELVQ
ncbi:MAG: redoxin domain-containing protein, partial [Chitinophagales bacterium]